MPPSQLKRLKSSLREQGITGPQKSKKQKKAAKGAKSTSDRIQKDVALQRIRDSFNPFELKAPSRPAKFELANSSTTNGVSKGSKYKDVLHRPGVSKSAGEEMRKKMLLPEMQRRSKVGGLVDRRIGEGDPGMTAEERAVQRFAQEKQRKKGASLFNLEDSNDDEPKMGLTHGGRNLDDLDADDFGEDISAGSGSDDGELMHRKRRRIDDEDGEEGDEEGASSAKGNDEPERKKTKKEVMEEVIAKSKLHKYERQKAKEDDDDLREELDSGMNDMLALLNGHKRPVPKPEEPKPEASELMMNPDRQRLLDGADPAKVDREYDARLKKLAQDVRARPSERTKTDEEKAIEEAARLRELEERRVKRMRGIEVSDDEGQDESQGQAQGSLDADEELHNEAAEFGFTNSVPQPNEKDKVVLDDEDDFELDEDLVASDSDADMSNESGSDQSSDDEAQLPNGIHEEDEEDEFVKGFADLNGSTIASDARTKSKSGTGLAFTYPCPRSHDELLEILRDSSVDQLPTIIQRIRALHHPSLSASNKEAMADFSEALVIHLSFMGTEKQPLATTEQVIRHLHSLSRTYPDRIATAFRDQLQQAYDRKELHAGDLVILTAIGSIYPTSDHFHQAVTPATTLMARWLSMTNIDNVQKNSMGGYLVALAINYQRLSKRYVPEAMRFTLRALSSNPTTPESKQAHVDNLLAMAELWKDKTSFIEIFLPALPILQALNAKKALQTLKILVQQSRINRRPLELHHHRPLPIRTNIPRFEDNFDPDKHYDPDKERSDAKKLQKEYKRERKGALRELRKDANFVARQQLQEKKQRDAEYEKKYRRLVAEIQGEEGHEAKEYEREKRARKRQK